MGRRRGYTWKTCLGQGIAVVMRKFHPDEEEEEEEEVVVVMVGWARITGLRGGCDEKERVGLGIWLMSPFFLIDRRAGVERHPSV